MGPLTSTTEPEWHADWAASRVHWPDLFADHAGKPGLRFLEIGVFEGASAWWTLTHVLTDASSRLDLIDPIEFTEIHDEPQLARIERHLAPWLENGQARLHQGRSGDVLRDAGRWRPEMFDVVYIDGDHFPAGVITDAVLTWPLVKPGGLILFDDYIPELGGHPGPRPAIDCFAEWYARWIRDARPVGPDQYLITKDR